MRDLPASGYNSRSTFKPKLKDRPDPEAKIGKLYDLLVPGKVVDYHDMIAIYLTEGKTRQKASSNLVTARHYLIDNYGLDIRLVQKNKWCLVGKTEGGNYTDYLAKNLKEG